MIEYDKIAKDYVNCNNRITKTYCHTPSFLKFLGDVKGKKVLDLGCGSGHYTRMLKKLGAKEVMGVDISKEMIKIAKKEEKKNPLGIKYYTKDISSFNKIGEFDIIVATFLLHYAKTKEELFNMIKNISINLKKRGKFLAINDNPKCKKPKNEKYFVKFCFPKKIREGDQIKLSLLNENKTICCSFITYRWDKKTYNKIFKKMNFKKILWKKPIVSKKGRKNFPLFFWYNYLNPCPVSIIIAYK